MFYNTPTATSGPTNKQSQKYSILTTELAEGTHFPKSTFILPDICFCSNDLLTL